MFTQMVNLGSPKRLLPVSYVSRPCELNYLLQIKEALLLLQHLCLFLLRTAAELNLAHRNANLLHRIHTLLNVGVLS